MKMVADAHAASEERAKKLAADVKKAVESSKEDNP